jgi:serine/threonine protein kinase
LANRLSRGPIPCIEAVEIAVAILAALDAAHRGGLVHRDVKPSNVFLTPHGVKLLDFGLARLASSEDGATETNLTIPGMVLGTPNYMAPEQVLGQTVDQRADLFAVGCVLFEMLAGKPPFFGESPVRVLHAITSEQPATLSGPPAIMAVDQVIRRALAKNPKDRTTSARVMAEELRATASIATSDERVVVRTTSRLMVLPFRVLQPDPSIDFLAFSLADAVASSLSEIETLVVRSPLAARLFVAQEMNLRAIAKEAEVEKILTGTLLHAGGSVRLSAQLLEVPSGTVLWSRSFRVSLDDLFELEDRLVHDIADSLTVSLSVRERGALRSDVPASAKAYEFYLRANPLSFDSQSWDIARDLYLQCVQLDPQYAPAWARLGRMYRLLAKFPQASRSGIAGANDSDAVALSVSAFNRALTLNPELALADSYYAQLELDLGRSQEAVVRLVRRTATRSNDADLFTALVSACRYCGLLEASFAADLQARRLDPNIRTSVTHTYFMAGDYLRAAEESERKWQTGNMGGLALLSAGHRDANLRLALEAERYGENEILPALIAYDHARVRVAIDQTLKTFPDPEFHFYAALMCAYVQEYARAIEILSTTTQRGFFPLTTLMRHAWLDPLRERTDFQEIVREAERRHTDARSAFVEAGGHRLLIDSKSAKP